MINKQHILNKLNNPKNVEMSSQEFEIQYSLENLKQEIRKYRERQNEMKFVRESDAEGRHGSRD